MTELLLIVTLAGQRIALRAADVEAVVEVGALVPVPRAPAHVAGLAALRSKVLTVIDCHASLAFEAPRPRRPRRHAVVTTVDGHNYALLIDQAEDVVEVALDVAVSAREEAPDRVDVALHDVTAVNGGSLIGNRNDRESQETLNRESVIVNRGALLTSTIYHSRSLLTAYRERFTIHAHPHRLRFTIPIYDMA